MIHYVNNSSVLQGLYGRMAVQKADGEEQVSYKTEVRFAHSIPIHVMNTCCPLSIMCQARYCL